MDKKIVDHLKNGKIGVIPTDTIYGIVGSALSPKTVEKIYKLRKRALDKPMIILISQLADLKKFDIKLTEKQNDFLKKIWPNPVSVVLPTIGDKFKYLHRGKKSLAFRLPKDERLLKILKEVGPIVAPSANFEGGKVAENIEEAKHYFGNKVALYIDDGVKKSQPSTVVSITDDGKLIVLRGSLDRSS